MNAIVTVSDRLLMESPTIASTSVIWVEPAKFHWNNDPTAYPDIAKMGNEALCRHLRPYFHHHHKGRKPKRGNPYRYRPR